MSQENHSKFKVITIPVGPLQTNCYLVVNETTKKALVFDPGEDAERIYHYISNQQLTVEAILFTHGHFDHIRGGDQLASLVHAKTYMSKEEKTLSEDANLNCSIMFGAATTLTPEVTVTHKEELKFLDTEIVVLATPGHTKGSVCYYFKEAGILISGDTLFFESYGRTDFPTGSDQQLEQSLTQILSTLPEEVVVYPGHGCETTIGYEKRNNPYRNGV